MHSLARRYIKTAIGFLMLGLVLGGWMLYRREIVGRASTPYEVSAHTHLILVGFVMMMILGVALWLFPRPGRDDARYRPAVAVSAYWMLTTATLGRAVGELLRVELPTTWLRAAIVVCGFAQIAAIALFFHTMWSRIRGLGSQTREARGERF